MLNLNGYQIAEVVSNGAQHVTYRAMREADQQSVIIKMLAEGNVEPAAAESLRKECALVSTLNDPGIVHADQLLDTQYGPAIVFPDLAPDTLRGLLGKRKLSVNEFLGLGIQLAEILARLHAKGVVHRDIKPSNILVDLATLQPILIDFGMAAEGGGNTESDHSLDQIEGTLAYIAPEQTGRMNRRVDCRSDLYSLGVTFYETLTGQRPFESAEPAELVHMHIAVPPPDISMRTDGLPKVLCQMVLKLLEKDPSQRYQSAAGLAYDLRALQSALNAGESLEGFLIGGRDVSHELRLPAAITGRTTQLAELNQMLREVRSNERRITRLSGPSGSGKSALVREFMQPVPGRSGYFITGKFEEFNRSRPYSGLIQAFEYLPRRLLSASPDGLHQWRQRLMAELSPNAQLIVDMIPAFEQILGRLPPVASLGTKETQIRFSLTFRHFVRALVADGTPLVLFLDDLQWADGATLKLLEDLLLDQDVRGLYLIAAYRQEDLSPEHPLPSLFCGIDQAAALPAEISLMPLQPTDLLPLLAKTLNEPVRKVESLAAILVDKTEGNPYFLHEFFESLVRQGMFSHDLERGTWTWDDEHIRNQQVTHNVVDLVIERISDLAPDTQYMLQVAACVGNTFDMRTVAMAAGRAESELDEALQDAIRMQVVRSAEAFEAESGDEEGGDVLLLARPVRYRFHHDRVQQAAHQMLGQARAEILHRKIGEHVLGEDQAAHNEDRMVLGVDHMNAALGQLDASEYSWLASLNLQAARLAKSAGGYRAANGYLSQAGELLERLDDQRESESSFEIRLEKAELAYLLGNAAESQDLCDALLATEQEISRRVRILKILILLHTSRLAYHSAISVAIDALALLGEPVPAHASQLKVAAEFVKTRAALGKRSPESLLSIPHAQEPRVISALEVMMLLAAPAYFVAPNLLPIIGMRMVRLSLRHGSAPQSAFGIAVFGMLHCAALGDMKAGLRYGQVAMDQVSRGDSSELKPQVEMLYAGFILHWNKPIPEVLPFFLDGAASAIEVGDLEYHGYCRYAHASYALMAGTPLSRVADLLDQHYAEVVAHKHEKTQRIMRMACDAVAILRGTAGADALVFDQSVNESFWLQQEDATSLAYLHKYRLLLALMRGDYTLVLEECHAMDEFQSGIMGMAFVPFYEFYKALALLVEERQSSRVRRSSCLSTVLGIRRRLNRWARHIPATLSHRVLLLDAELAVFNGDREAAMKLFEEAVEQAVKVDALHDQALILERTLAFYAEAGIQSVTRGLFPRVLRSYRAWGAEAWCMALADRYPELHAASMRSETASVDPLSSTTSSRTTVVDLAMVTKAAQVISEQVSWRDAVAQVMDAVMINSGATRALLFVPEGEDFQLVSEITKQSTEARLLAVPLDCCERVPFQVLRYVINSRSSLVLDSTNVDPAFAADPYLESMQRLSVICAPLKRKGELVGVIYLENDLAEGVFTSGLLTTVELLSAQAAITIENARLYDELRSSLEHQVELTTAHARFVPQEFLETLGRTSIAEVRLGDHVNIKASILYSDIRDFTPLIESMSAERGIEFINEYIDQVEPAILSAGGFVDTYLGDALLAIFKGDPDAALSGAIEMQHCLRRWNASRTSLKQAPVDTGIGVVTGDLMLGTIGAASRLKCSVIGDTVNLAARIESLTKRYAVPFLISDGTRELLREPDRFLIREVDQVTVVGRSTPVTLFEVFDAENEPLRELKQSTLSAFSDALQLYRAGALSEATQAFTECRGREDLRDPLVEMYIERCARYLDVASLEEWDGIERFTSK